MFVTDATHLPRLMQCFGSSQMPIIVPIDDDPAQRDEGNAAHYMAQQVFSGRATLAELTGQKAYNGHIMDAEMSRHVAAYLSALDCGEMEVFTSFGNERWQVNARADHISWRANILTVDDFKYGHRLVMPDNNWTLIAHAIGYCILHSITPHEIVLRIHQLRRYHPDGPLREWRINYAQLMDFYHAVDFQLSNAEASLFTGPACSTCHAAPTCPAYRDASMNAIDATSALFTDDLPAETISAELDLLAHAKDVIEGRLKALQELATHKIAHGAVIPMYGVETQFANRRFKKTFDPRALKIMTGVDATEPKLVTPAEYQRRGVSEDLLNILTERPATGRKLVRVDASKRAERLLKKGK